MNNKLFSFINNLISDTNSGKIRWSASSVSDEYRLDMPSGLLLISYSGVDESRITLHLFRKSGGDQLICSAKVAEESYGLLSSLYHCVQNSFSVTIDSLISELFAMSNDSN